MPLRFSVGGCVYRNMVHVRHMGSVMQLCASSNEHALFSHFSYMHTSNLPAGRWRWLKQQIDWLDDEGGRLEWAVSVDSDSEFDGTQLHAAMQFVHGPRAIGVVPMVIGGGAGLLNVNDRTGRLTQEDMRRAFSGSAIANIEHGGFGVAVFNLRWFRANYIDPRPEGDFAYGEDINACVACRHRGGAIVALRVDSVHRDLVPVDAGRLNW